MIFTEIAPFVIILTLLVCSLFAINVNKKNLCSLDSIFSVSGFILGLLITLLNLKFSNNYLITLGPILAVTCLSYLKLKDNLSLETINLYIDRNNSKILNILFWTIILTLLIIYQQAPLYNRPILFFIGFSLNITLIIVEIFCFRPLGKLTIYSVIFKILFLSLILRASAFFISPFPVGSDPWGHSDYIKDIIYYGVINVPETFTSKYYSHYPLMHIYASVVNLIGSFDIKASLFFIGISLTLSSLFVYLLAEKVTGNPVVALFSIALVNFSDISIQWSIEIIAMSLGIAIYTIMIYLLVSKNGHNNLIYNSFIILYIFIITWTHTISLFITFVSFFGLYVGSIIYDLIYKKSNNEKNLASFTLIVTISVMMIFHWLNPDYPFFKMILKGLIESLNSEVKFLGKLTSTNIEDSWYSIIDILGFLFNIIFGVIGSLFFLSKEFTNKRNFSLIFMITTLFFIFFVFPVMGLKNIIPGRWPPFIYVGFIPFVAFGFFIFICKFKNSTKRNIFILITIFIISFFNITSSISNMDSPFLEEKAVSKFIWTDSEMSLCKGINQFYSGTIATDIQTAFGPLETYYKNNNTQYFRYGLDNKVDYNYMSDALIIWRHMSLSRPVTFDTRPRRSAVFLGIEFKDHVDKNYSNIYDTGGARAYLNLSKSTN